MFTIIMRQTIANYPRDPSNTASIKTPPPPFSMMYKEIIAIIFL